MTGKHVVVTGAGTGIGRAIARRLARDGWAVGVNDIEPDRAAAVARELSAMGTRSAAVVADVGDAQAVARMVAQTLEVLGAIDLLVNNAGIFVPKPFTDYTEEDYQLVMNTNVASMFFMTQQVIPQMKKQRAGHVAYISTTLANQPSSGLPAFMAVLSKSPMAAISKALAIEYAADHIRFNTISPGVVNTPMHAGEDHTALAAIHPLGRIAEISEIVDTLLYLQNATFVTGENIHVDGGFHAGR